MRRLEMRRLGQGVSWRRLWRQVLPGVLALLVAAGSLMVTPEAAQASIHEYREQPGQVTIRSRQSLRDRRDRAWQATLFQRYRGGHRQGTYLRLVGFPGVVGIAQDHPLVVATGVGQHWQAPAVIDPQAKAWPENVAQFEMTQVLADCSGAMPLELTLDLQNGESAQVVVAPFVVQEWLDLLQRSPETAS